MTISIGIEKASDKIQHPFMIKNSHQSGYRGNIFQHNMAIYGKPEANTILNTIKLKAFSLNSETRRGCPLFPLSSLPQYWKS